MTVKEAAALLGVTDKRIYALIRCGGLDVVEKKTPLIVTTNSALRYLETRRSAGRPASK